MSEDKARTFASKSERRRVAYQAPRILIRENDRLRTERDIAIKEAQKLNEDVVLLRKQLDATQKSASHFEDEVIRLTAKIRKKEDAGK